MDEYETRYHTKLDTMSKVTALKIFLNPKVMGEKFNGLEYEQDATGQQEMREQFHHYLLDSQMHNGPVAMKFNAIMDNTQELS